jgi:hypothetical protein
MAVRRVRVYDGGSARPLDVSDVPERERDPPDDATAPDGGEMMKESTISEIYVLLTILAAVALSVILYIMVHDLLIFRRLEP